MRDQLTKFEHTYIPTLARIDVPLLSVVNLRRIASEFRGLAERLDQLSRDPDEAAVVLAEARSACLRTRRNLSKIKRPGRPVKQEHSTRWTR